MRGGGAVEEAVVDLRTVAEVLDEPYSQLTPLSGIAIPARQSIYISWNRVQYPSYIAYRAGMATLLSGVS
jgi:hypothetical protein